MATKRSHKFLSRLTLKRLDENFRYNPQTYVLLLRSFRFDGMPISIYNDGWKSVVTAFLGSKRNYFEERLKATFEDIGAFITIGQPGESILPFGAAREYIDNTNWQNLVLKRAQSARLIIMVIDEGSSIEWEIGHVTRQVELQRILIILPPNTDFKNDRSDRWYQAWASLKAKFSFLPDVSKDSIAIAFDNASKPIVITGRNLPVHKQLEKAKLTWLTST